VVAVCSEEDIDILTLLVIATCRPGFPARRHFLNGFPNILTDIVSLTKLGLDHMISPASKNVYIAFIIIPLE
jgi:hypothetical protein